MSKQFTKQQIDDIIRKTFVAILCLPKGVIDTDTLESLGGDSLDAIEIIMLLEEELEIEITDDEGDKYSSCTVKELVETLFISTLKSKHIKGN